jgi:hypothetical protein
MEQYLFRRSPLPPRRKTIGQILWFGVVSIFLISVMVFTLYNPRIFCEGTGGRWVRYPEWVGQKGYGYTDSTSLSAEQPEFFGKCFR